MPVTINGTSGITNVDGTAAAPALTGTDTDTGIFFPAANTLAFSTAGTEDARFDSAGNFGIGTSSPSVKLHVSTSAAGIAEPVWLNNSQAVGAGVGSRLVFTGTTNNNGLAAIDGAFAGATTADGGYMVFNTRAVTSGALTERMRLDSSGNLGLGVTPSVWNAGGKVVEIGATGLGIWGNSTANFMFVENAYYNSGWKYASTNGAAYYQMLTNSHAWFNAPSGTAGNAITFTQAMTLDASGNLGLGATSPLGAFEIIRNSSSGSGVLYPNIRLDNQNASGYTGIYFLNANTNKAFFEVKNDVGALTMGTGGTERARITSGGYFKASNTGAYRSATTTHHEFYQTNNDPGLTVTCTNTSQTTNCLRVFAARNTTGNSYYAIEYYNDGADTSRFRVADSGNVTNTNNSYGAISDIKLKENITDATPKLAGLMQVRVRNYNLKSDPTHKQLGVIAQELEQVFPGMVEESPDRDADGNDLGTTTKQVKYSVFVPMLIKAMQEQQAIIESLKADVAALKGNT